MPGLLPRPADPFSSRKQVQSFFALHRFKYRSMHILHVVGARPNFMKAAPVLRALAASPASPVRQTLVHTGQHYDAAMSGVFFQQLEMPAPDLNLEVGSGS